jgi:RND family efflux transporter MFP subunit
VTDLKQDLESLRLPAAGFGVKRNRRRLVAVVASLLVVFGGALWTMSGHAVEVETLTPTVETAADVVAGSPMLTASGYVVARRRAVVSAKIQGRLAELKVEEGARVNEGETFARLESADFEAAVGRSRAQLQRAEAQIAGADAAVAAARAQVDRSEAELAEAERQLDVAERLSKDELLPADELLAARSRVRVAQASVGLARAEVGRAQADILRVRAEYAQAQADVRYNEALLQNTYIRAPFTGTVVRKMAEVGESVAPIPPGVNISTASGAIVALADLDTLEVEVDVAEANVATLEPNQPAEVIVEAFQDQKYKGVLRQVIPTADRTRATVMVKVTILDKDARLKPEMSAKVTFLEPARPASAAAAAEKVVLVPRDTVVTRDGSTQVFTVVDGIAQPRPVTVGAPRQDRVIVTEGLTGSETLVARPGDNIRPGVRVRVRGA